MKLLPEQRRLLSEACENLDFQLETDYSGRSMYGRECFGFVTEQSGAELKLAGAMMESCMGDDEEQGLVLSLINKMSQAAKSDSMGRSTIYYYPGLEWGEKE